jgi:ATP-dependent Clp protease adaptor protein ClpS
LETKVFYETDINQKIKEPKMYKVILLNDDYTTMEFVVEILTDIFHKSVSEATKIMLDVHKKGQGLVGVYTYDIANTKINQTHKLAKENNFPLKAIMEEL